MAFNLSKKIRFLTITLAIFIAGVVLFFCLPEKAPILSDTPISDIVPMTQINVPVEMDARLFYSAVEEYPTAQAADMHMAAAGGIIPHHAVASPILAEFFAKLAKSDPDIGTFIILGPNHLNQGTAPVISCRALWRTPLGDVATDYSLLETLEKTHFLAFDEKHCTSDQTVRTLVPFIRYYFPRAKIAPLLFSSEEGKEKSMLLAGEIARVKSYDMFVLASLDFSHYLSFEEAKEKDVFTAAAIEAKDYPTISRLGSDYVDSPFALITFLHAMELSGADKSEILRHANSADFPGQTLINTTSYFSMVYGKQGNIMQ